MGQEEPCHPRPPTLIPPLNRQFAPDGAGGNAARFVLNRYPILNHHDIQQHVVWRTSFGVNPHPPRGSQHHKNWRHRYPIRPDKDRPNPVHLIALIGPSRSMRRSKQLNAIKRQTQSSPTAKTINRNGNHQSRTADESDGSSPAAKAQFVKVVPPNPQHHRSIAQTLAHPEAKH